MYDVMGVINLFKEYGSLDELTYYRNQASVPFAGKYRLIDFTLSNMVNSGIQDIAVLTNNKYRSLMDHLGTGKDWDLDRRRGGLFILPPSFHYSNEKGDLQYFHQHLDFFIRGFQKYVLITTGHIVANIDYRPAFHFHKQTGADITLIYQNSKENQETVPHGITIQVEKDGRISAFGTEENPLSSNKVSMEMFIMEKALLLQMIDRCMQNEACSLVRDGIINQTDQLKIVGFPHQGYAASIHSIESYYRQSMALLNPDIWQGLFYQSRMIYTKSKNDPPAKYLAHANVKDSLIANGCRIEGKVENSILFRGVSVGKGAYIKNSVIMQKTEIGENALIEHAVLDKKTVVTSGKTVKGEKEKPFVLSKRMRI